MTDVRDRVREVCRDAVEQLPAGAASDAVGAVGAKLDEPLQVTVAGGVSSGKSTLVNALLGQRVAPVDAGECTRVVTRFRYGHHEHAEVHLLDGTVHQVALAEGSLPAELPAPPTQVREVVVHLSNGRLRTLGIVDTPGMNTTTSAHEDAAGDFLGLTADGKAGQETAQAIGRADALVLLMPHLRQSDASVLQGFRRLYSGHGLSSFNALAVLSKIDQLAPTGDPLEVAAPIADRVAGETRGLVSDVLPVLGLLAETATTASLTEHDARDLATLAAFGDDLDREDLLVSADSFLTLDGPDVPVERRQRLLALIGLYGVRLAFDLLDSGSHGAGPLLREFEQRSGLAPLQDLVFGRLGRHASLLKAHHALSDLRRLAHDRGWSADEATVMARLRAPLEQIELDPSLHHLRVVEVLQDAIAGDLRLPATMVADLERLATGTDPLTRLGATRADEARQAAARGASVWGRFANDPRRRPPDARRARAVKEAYELLWAELDGGAQ